MSGWRHRIPKQFVLGSIILVGMMGLSLALASVGSAQEVSATGTVAAGPTDASGQAGPTIESVAKTAGDLTFSINNITLFLCAVLVIFMQAGFAMVEVGLNAAKNAVNILAKNLLDFALGSVLFFAIGYAIMYPGFAADGGTGEFFKIDTNRIMAIPAWDGASTLHPQVDFLFQVAFAATAATIVSGAVAGRMKLGAYLIYTAVLTAFVYPVSGSWKWGYGWLHDMGFHDFAGSILVHCVGGFAGLAGAMLLGPRIGRYAADGRSVPMPGHNITFTTLGVFILLIGWYGFNPGSQLLFADPTNVGTVMTVAVNTTLAACTGCLSALVLAWVMFGKPDLSMALNGMLGGLVGITANCDCVSNISALIIGAVAGVLVLLAVVALDKLRIDDPVGAFPVHGVCGIWGGLAAALFGGKALMPQLVGIAAICAWSFVTMIILFSILKAIGFLRVPVEEEKSGLDLSHHGMQAYAPDGVPGSTVGAHH
jgi:Amt family ammonium transporter